jgi:ADP-ribose pyrophosphatase
MKPDALKETQLASEQVFKGNFLDVRRDTVRLPNGHAVPREYVVHPGACVVIPLLDNGDVVLEKQYRYPVGREMIEFPAGKLDPNEDPLICALRAFGHRLFHGSDSYLLRAWLNARRARFG